MSKLLMNSAIGGAAAAGAVAVAVATGVIDWPGGETPPASAPQQQASQEPGPVSDQSADQNSGQNSGQKPQAEQTAALQPPAETPSETPSGAASEPEAEAAPEPEQPAQDTSAPEAADDPAPDVAAAPEPDPEPEQTAAADPRAPRFDTVREMPGGGILVAGSAEPLTKVEILVDGAPGAETEAGGDGKFATFLDLVADGSVYVLTLRSLADGKELISAREVIVAPVPETPPVNLATDAPGAPQSPQEDSAGAGATQLATAEVRGAAPGSLSPAPSLDGGVSAVPLPRTGGAPDTLAAPADGAAPSEPGGFSAPRTAGAGALANGADADSLPTADETVAALAEQGDDPAPQPQGDAIAAPATQATDPTPQAPAPQTTVLIAGPSGVEVLGTAPLAPGEVALDTISYDNLGDVLLAGRGHDAGFVRVYLDNAPVTTSRIRDDGRWQVQLPEVDTGTYTLRVDQVDEGGDVVARVESPFLREDPELLEQLSRRKGPITEITVQPGHTLWEISEDRYGHGVEYVKIFRANKDRIRNPDLIYPGQIFDLPDESDAAATE